MMWRAAAAAFVLTLAFPAAALADAGKTVTATGTGQSPVVPTNRMSDPSIRAAIDAARKLAIPAALANARDRAGSYAAAAGLTLGGVQSVSDSGQNGIPPVDFPMGPPPFEFSLGPSGIQNYCGIARTPVFRGRANHGKPIRFIPHRVCFVPPTATVIVTVTYTAT